MGPHTRVHVPPYGRYLEILEKGILRPLNWVIPLVVPAKETLPYKGHKGITLVAP